MAHDVAIIGLSGLFPKAPNVRRFWQNIVNRLDAVGEIPPGRFDVARFFNPDRAAPDQIYSRWGSFLDEVLFDPLQWMIPPAILAIVEPAQLLALGVAWDALVDAGLDRLTRRNRLHRRAASAQPPRPCRPPRPHHPARR